MKLDLQLSLRDALLECLGWFEALRKLGFPAEEIFFVIYTDGVAIRLHTQGKAVDLVALTVDRMPSQHQVVAATWNELSARWNGKPAAGALALTEGERDELFRRSWPYRHALQLSMGLVSLGFVFPSAAPGATMRPGHA